MSCCLCWLCLWLFVAWFGVLLCVFRCVLSLVGAVRVLVCCVGVVVVALVCGGLYVLCVVCVALS